MATESDFRDIANSLNGTTHKAHFDRIAFRVKRNYVTLAADGLTANFKFSPDEQELKCMVHPKGFVPVDNAWGKQGWTMCTLSAVTIDELRDALDS